MLINLASVAGNRAMIPPVDQYSRVDLGICPSELANELKPMRAESIV